MEHTGFCGDCQGNFEKIDYLTKYLVEGVIHLRWRRGGNYSRRIINIKDFLSQRVVEFESLCTSMVETNRQLNLKGIKEYGKVQMIPRGRFSDHSSVMPV